MNSSRRSIRPKWRAGSWKKECLPWRFCWHGGNPNRKNTERWIYTRSGTGWSLGLGGGGFRGRDSGIGTGIGVTMPLGSRPPVSCNVLFEDGKVIGWEAVNGF